MIYSASRLETYRQCPYKFKLTYIDHVSSDLEGIEAFMGSRVHEALEKLYIDLKFCRKVSLVSLLEDYRQNWGKKWHESVRIVREGLTPDDYLALGEKCIEDYYRRYQPFDQARTLGIEHPLKFYLDEEKEYSIKGFIDRVSQPRDKVIWIHDYKTKGFLPTQQDLDDDRQLAYYQMGVSQLWPDTEEIELVWHYLIFDQEIHSRRTVEELACLRDETIKLIDEIESTTDFPTRKSGLCNWCEHQSVCPHFRHLYETEALPKNEYLGEEGVQLAERLVALQSEEAKMKAEISKVKEALCDYAERKAVEAVFTREHKVLIKFYGNTKFPGWKDPGRERLETLVRKAGKWDEVSSLDVFALSKVIQKGEWEENLVAEINKFGTPDRSPWIKAFPRNGRRG